MTDASVPSPENTLATGDPGDEVTDRFRFQWTWAAITCCSLLDDTVDIEEVFCEHHEDILVKHKDGLFTGHQVKTRSDAQPPWKAKDESVLGACVRFAALESAYPGNFQRFFFLTNHPLHSTKNGQDLRYVLKEIKDANNFSSLPSNVASWVRRVARDAGVSQYVAFSAMSKTVAKADLPKLNDALMRLINSIVQCWPPANECSHDSLVRAANELIAECCRASSLDHKQLLPAYLIAATEEESDVAERINGKRMTLTRVESILERGRDSTATLSGDPALYVEPGKGSTELLHKKLDAGGFSVVSRNSAEDLRDKADYLALKWTNKYGNKKGLERYDHVRSTVLSDAGRAFDATQTESGNFGPAMREDLHQRFSMRRVAGDQLYDCTDDHLEGFAFSLTAQCRIVWSHARPWESD